MNFLKLQHFEQKAWNISHNINLKIKVCNFEKFVSFIVIANQTFLKSYFGGVGGGIILEVSLYQPVYLYS